MKGKAPGAVRIVFVGDRMVSGEGATAVPTDPTFYGEDVLLDGSRWGYQGFPYAFGQLLKEKKPNMSFELLNYGGIDYGIKGNFWDSCDYQKTLRSQPDIVVMMFGASELKDIHTLDDKTVFRNSYIKLGQQYMDLPSKPQIYVVTPPGLKLDEPVPLAEHLDIPESNVQNRRHYSNVQLPMLLQAVADGLNLPTENRIDLFSLFGGDSMTEHADW